MKTALNYLAAYKATPPQPTTPLTNKIRQIKQQNKNYSAMQDMKGLSTGQIVTAISLVLELTFHLTCLSVCFAASQVKSFLTGAHQTPNVRPGGTHRED